MKGLRYSIFDPTGNITALVESEVPPAAQPDAAALLMARHPALEQVGFVRFSDGGPCPVSLRMAGGEFCGNASMSAAALYLLRSGRETPAAVTLQVSGTSRAVEVRLENRTEDCFSAGVRMPRAREIGVRELSFGGECARLPYVRMEGIAHLIVPWATAFFRLLHDKTAAEEAALRFCRELSAEALGLMFLELEGETGRLTPLVYVPGSQTLFWERSCASGSAAVGAYLAAKEGAPVAMTLDEPGGSLRFESDPAGGETWLYGRTRLVGAYEY